jgi:two-component system, sensor histidine kinase YcbA
MVEMNKRLAMNSYGRVTISIALLTTFASEIKVVPFEGEVFRFGLGSMAFFLLILIWSPSSLIRVGTVTGLTVVLFRITEDLVFRDALLLKSVLLHFPVFFFYFFFAWGLHLLKVETYKDNPLILGAWVTLVEFVANALEQLVRHELLNQEHLHFSGWLLLSGVAIIRSYFVVGLYASITVSEQKKRMEEMLEVRSELYAETLYLQKSMDHIEKITAASHELYRKLKQQELHQLSVQALSIAQEIHEVKKDSQRILSGLRKIHLEKSKDAFFLTEVAKLVVSANEKYAAFLEKKIDIHLQITVDFETDKHVPLLALLNNITANAVESIDGKGEITLEVFEASSNLFFKIKDSGKGIPKEDLSVIFEPGYTTKYNEKGVAATGIGLSHVQEIVHLFEGKIQVDTSDQGTSFQISLPSEHVRK